MATVFDDIIDQSIRYLSELRNQGKRFVAAPPPLQTTSPVQSVGSPDRVEPLPFTPREPPVASAAAQAAQGELTLGERLAALEALRQRARACVKCPHLASVRHTVVFGVGNAQASLMFVGEAPGADEDRMGEPFVGRAGQLLTRIIEAMGLRRSDVYIANVLKCRPDTPGQTMGNRKPTPEEMRTCSPYLLAQIVLIRPLVLVGLGASALEGLLGEATPIGRLRGRWQTFRGIPLMPTFHPSYLLRQESVIDKRKVWEDMMAVMERLNMPISAKQRAFFSRS